MEDYGWLIFIAFVWLLSTVGEMRKAQAKRRREAEREGREPGEGRAVGPAAGQRDLERDLDEAARRAQDALRRWEARQAAAAPTEPAASRAPSEPGVHIRREASASAARRRRERLSRERGRRFGVELGEVASRRASAERREAYEGIAGMLGGAAGPGARPAAEPVRTRVAADRPPAMPLRESPIVGRELGSGAQRATSGRVPGGAASTRSGLERLDRLPMLQRAVVLHELLGPPIALRSESDLP